MNTPKPEAITPEYERMMELKDDFAHFLDNDDDRGPCGLLEDE